MSIQPLEAIFDSSDWSALLQSGDINQDEFDAWTSAASDYEFDQRWDIEVRTRAASLATTANEGLDLARSLRRRILESGGISKSDHDIPSKYIRKSGFPMDCIAEEVGFADDRAMLEAIESSEELIGRLPIVSGKRISKFRVKDFLIEANDSLVDERGRVVTNEDGIPF